MLRSIRARWAAWALIALFSAALAGGYAWLRVFNPCEVDAVTEASDFLVIQLKQYDNVYASAITGTRTSLTYPVMVMQQILVDTQQVDVPVCMQEAKGESIEYMSLAIRALQAFAAEEEDQLIRDLVYQSNTHYGHFYAELNAVQECAPYCFR